MSFATVIPDIAGSAGLGWLIEFGVAGLIIWLVFALLKRQEAMLKDLTEQHAAERETSETRWAGAFERMSGVVDRLSANVADGNVYQAALGGALLAVGRGELDLSKIQHAAQEAAERVRAKH